MTDDTATQAAGWFAGLEGDTDDPVPDSLERAREAITRGRADVPRDWPSLAVEAGYVDSTADYYDRLHELTVRAVHSESRARLRADDQQLIHALRALEDCRRTANELAERLTAWGESIDSDAGSGPAYARELVEDSTLEADSTPEARALRSLATRVTDLLEEADSLERYIEQRAPVVAPNLTALAGPLLAARLLALAGGLESLAKKPSGTIQVLGAEEALFAHLRGHAPSPKHGVIFTHEAVRGTRAADRGSAARALAGKLAIAARIDHYSGEYRPELEAELRARIETIQSRAGDSTTLEGNASESTSTAGDDDG